MNRILCLVATVVGLLVAGSALAVTPNAWTGCGTDITTDGTGRTLTGVLSDADRHICYKFDESEAGNPVYLNINSDRASCNLERDLATTGGTAQVQVRACGAHPATRDANSCSQLITTMAADTDLQLTRGEYIFTVSTAVTAGEDAVFSCRVYR